MNPKDKTDTKSQLKAKIKFGILLIPLILIFLPANFFDSGQTVCISKLLLNIECLGCGMTRAIQHAIHLDLSTAYHFNKLVVVVLPLLLFVYVKELITTYRIMGL